MNDRGSALVEAIGMIALTVLLTVGVINVAFAIQMKSRLASVATLAARAGAIDSSLAWGRVHQELDVSTLVGEEYRRDTSSGLCFFEVVVRSEVETIIGSREVTGRGHALCER